MFGNLTFFDLIRLVAAGLICLNAFLVLRSNGRKGFVIPIMALSAMSSSLFIWTLLMDGFGMAQILPPIVSIVVLADTFTGIFVTYLLIFRRVIK